MDWDKAVEVKFKTILGKMPVFLRGIAEKKVSDKAQSLAGSDGRDLINEKDLVDAFFAETPFGFQGPLKNDLTELGIDYTKYGYPR